MSLAFGILLTVIAVVSTVFVLGLFVWAAYKDGEDNAAVQSRVIRRRWPREQK